jgi:hypothetical protein
VLTDYLLCGFSVGVESALCSLLLSLAICVAAVSVFTAHPLLLLPILLTILGKILLIKPLSSDGPIMHRLQRKVSNNKI